MRGAGSDPAAALAHPPDVADHPAVRRAAALAADLLAPAAAEVDTAQVPRSHLDALGAAGLLGLPAPDPGTGAPAPAAVVRAVAEELAGACGATWFVATQHAAPLLAVARSGNAELRDRYLVDLRAGRLLGGVAVAHLRRPGPPAVTARRDGAGWRVDGAVPWLTGWGLADVALLGARTPDGRHLLALVPAREGPGLAAGSPLRTVAMAAAVTVRIHLDGLHVPDAAVADVVPAADWLARDRLVTANATPAAFGLLRAVVSELGRSAGGGAGSEAQALATALAEEGARVRTAAYALLDEVPAAERVADRLALRAHALELLTRAAAALVAAAGGAATGLDRPHQRLAREALFHLVQAQTGPVRRATLARFAERSGPAEPAPAESADGDDAPAVGVGPWPGPPPDDPRYDPVLLATGDRRNVADRYRYWRREAVVADLDERRHDFHVAIENWRHDRNIGTVVRTANAFLAREVHVVGRRRWNRRGAMVTDRYQHVRHHHDVAALAAWCAEQGLPVVAVDNLPGAQPLESVELPRRCLLMFGQEGPGLTADARAAAQLVVSIAQYGSTRSINAGVAAGIAMHAWVRRHADPPPADLGPVGPVGPDPVGPGR